MVPALVLQDLHVHAVCGILPEPSLNFPIAPMGETSETLSMYVILQGGGLWIDGADVTMTNCNIYENTASYVSACFLNLP